MNGGQQSAGNPGGGGVATTNHEASMQATAAQAKAKQRNSKPKRKVLTSLFLEILIAAGYLWGAFYYIVNILVFIYKGVTFPIPQHNFAMEFCFAWFWIFIDIPRMWLLSHGNLTENSSPIFFATTLSVPLFAMYAYFLIWQTYVVKMDQILNIGSIIVLGFQVVWSIYVWFKFVFFTRFAP